MASMADFAAECEAAAKALRRMPADVRRALAAEVKSEVAVPLAAKIGAAATGPYAARISGAVKARAAADPTIVAGGGRRVVSGGATPRQLIPGTEWGGGVRVTQVYPRRGRAHRRRTTNQFVPAHPFIFPTISKQMPTVLDQFAGIVLRSIDKGLTHG